MQRLRGARTLVTGGSRGIGRTLVRRLVAEGAQVLFTYRRSAAAARELAGETGAGCLQADLALPEECRRVAESAGSLDLLVNNAGVLDPLASGDPLVAWDHTLAVNLRAVFLLCRLLAPRMSEGASIVNLGSVARAAYPGAPHYAASKAGVSALTATLALELAPRVRVNCLAPGYVNTGEPEGWDEGRHPELAARIPMQRFGRPEDVAAAVVFLAAEAPYMTGQTLLLDGGLSLALPGLGR